jgi:hypothetical protein
MEWMSAGNGAACRRVSAAVALCAGVLLWNSGCVAECGDTICAPLPPAVTATVRDAVDGGIVHAAVVNGFPFECIAACPVQLPDAGYPYRSGPVPVTVSAPGYREQSRMVDVPTRSDDSCCPLLYQPQQLDVALVPL